MKTLHIMLRIIRQTVNDRRSLALIMVVPVFLFTLINFLLGDSDYKAKVALNSLPSFMVDELKESELVIKTIDGKSGEDAVKDGDIDAYITMKDKELYILFKKSDAVKTSLVTKAVQDSMIQSSGSGQIRMDYIYGDGDSNMFQSMGYLLLGVISFFLIFLLAGISFVRERTIQTMERLMATPVLRWQVVLGYTLGYGFFAMIQSLILLCFVKYVLGMNINGTLWEAGIIMILLSMSAVCIGAFCSIYANNEFQMMQFIPIIVIPQIFFSGLISLDTIPWHLGNLAKIMPVYYACEALNIVVIQGESLSKGLSYVGALGCFIGFFFVLNILALKKYRRI